MSITAEQPEIQAKGPENLISLPLKTIKILS